MEYTLFQDFARKIPRPAPPTSRQGRAQSRRTLEFGYGPLKDYFKSQWTQNLLIFHNITVIQVKIFLIIFRLALRCVHANLPDITGRTLAVWPDGLNAKYHVITNATYSCHNRDPVQAKFKHVTNIETCTLLCCDHIALWKALDANMVKNGARYSDKNIKILVRYQWISW